MSPKGYAEGTTVNVGATKDEIERLLMKRGCSGFTSGWVGDRTMVQFEAHGRRIRFEITLPGREEERFTKTPTGQWSRTEDQSFNEWQKEVKRLWRCMLLTIKSKLTSVDEGIELFEEAFMAQIVLPDGTTVATHLKPKLAEAYRLQDMTPLLPGPQGSE